MDVGDHTAAGNGGLDERVQLLITTNGELQMARSDTLHAQITGSVAGELENLGAKILADGRHVDSTGCADATMASDADFEVAMYTSHGKLFAKQASKGRERSNQSEELAFPKHLNCALEDSNF